MEITLNIRTIRSKVALLDSHVGEELWDAAKIFAAHLCKTSDVYTIAENNNGTIHLETSERAKGVCCGKLLRGKRVLELGAGVAALGMCAAALGAKEVLCTDYDKDVLHNLEFNLKHNLEVINHNSISDASKEERNCVNTAKLSFAKLDWRSFASDDVKSAGWIFNDEEVELNDHEIRVQDKVQELNADIVIGSALVYSAQGALYCADTIKHFLIDRDTEECWILQMPSRPGFDRFLLRLEYWGLDVQSFDISELVFEAATKHMGNVHSTIEDFKLYVITSTVNNDPIQGG